LFYWGLTGEGGKISRGEGWEGWEGCDFGVSFWAFFLIIKNKNKNI